MKNLISWAAANKQKAAMVLGVTFVVVLVIFNIATKEKGEEPPEPTLLEFETGTNQTPPEGCVMIDNVLICENI